MPAQVQPIFHKPLCFLLILEKIDVKPRGAHQRVAIGQLASTILFNILAYGLDNESVTGSCSKPVIVVHHSRDQIIESLG